MPPNAILTTTLLAAAMLAGCGRPADSEAARPASAPVGAAAGAAGAAGAAPPASAAASVPAVAVPAAPTPSHAAVRSESMATQVWRVQSSSAAAVGTLYVFLPDGTLLVASPGSRPATGSWKRRPGGGITMVEASRSYQVDVLEASTQRLRLRSHNPGTPVDITLAPAPQPAAQVPAAFIGEWNAERADCGRPGTETRLRIEAGRIRLHESAGELLAVLPDGARDLALVSRVAGEGQTRLAYRRYRLAGDGGTLTDITDVTDGAAGGLVRRRCP